MTKERKQLILARERGFCGGVRAALALLERLLADAPDEPVYILHELVHNRHVTGDLRRRGVRFADDLSEVPRGARLLFGAHGVAPETVRRAEKITERIFDASCPLVRERQRAAALLGSDDTLILLGYPGHAEVEGILGYSNAGANFVVSDPTGAERIPDAAHPVLISQTTFSEGALEKCREILTRRFPRLVCRGGLCRSSQARQQSVAELAGRVEAMVVVGSAHSSNARRLCETAERCGARGFLVEGAAELPDELFGCRRVGLAAGASTPDGDVEVLAAAFTAAGFDMIDLKRSEFFEKGSK